MHIVLCSLYYDRFPKIGFFKNKQYITLLTVSQYIALYQIISAVS